MTWRTKMGKFIQSFCAGKSVEFKKKFNGIFGRIAAKVQLILVLHD